MPIIGVIASSDRNVPSAPTIGTATDVGTGRAYNNGAATVTFTAPTYTGGLPITGYTVTSSPGGFTGTGASSPITVTGLQSATAYTFTVTATNAAGTSAASSASNSITATTVPQAPTIGTATDGGTGTTVSVAFTGNATGGKAISTYTATSSPGSLTGTGGSSPITVSGLTAGTAYTFTVTATNANGTSAASAASNSVTPQVPGAFNSIASTTFAGPVTSVTISGISSSYKHLVLRCWIGGTNQRDLRAQLNGDTNNNYHGFTVQYYNNASFLIGQYTGSAFNDLGRVTGNFMTGFIDYLPNYSRTDSGRKTQISYSGGQDTAQTSGVNFSAGMWNNTGAISSITITSSPTGIKTDSVVSLYGIS